MTSRLNKQPKRLDEYHGSLYLIDYEVKINKLLHQKYSVKASYYYKRVINDIIFNEKTHLVSRFKDHLINDDNSEFLRRYYRRKESAVRLPRFFAYYDSYSKIFPNYTSIRESKYIYKNIHKKQKMIDQQQEKSINNEKDKGKVENSNHSHCNHTRDSNVSNRKIHEVFSTEVYNSIVNDNEDISLLFNLKGNEENDFESKVNASIDRISQLEIKQETLVEHPLMKLNAITPRLHNPLFEPNYLFSLQSPVNRLINDQSHYQFPHYPQHQFLFHQNYKHTIDQARNGINDPIQINRLCNDHHQLIKNKSVSQLSAAILSQAMMSKHYLSSLTPLTYREGDLGNNNNNNIDETNKGNNNYNIIEESSRNTPIPIIKKKFKIATHSEFDPTKSTRNMIGNNQKIFFHPKKMR